MFAASIAGPEIVVLIVVIIVLVVFLRFMLARFR